MPFQCTREHSLVISCRRRTRKGETQNLRIPTSLASLDRVIRSFTFYDGKRVEISIVNILMGMFELQWEAQTFDESV
ncbi:unnamed protein product [Acanthoscelides obtectus]|uniref:Uncharacterized protein n=1 Tax=Acanthoscelides obtectus TaxID=200917 RepID=A0A9P0P652_ACAOB|nr:unnamed protein product [Acanthoscelides obtectus]CAK1640011.1 hypothetical protein AOBTE_LOCUS11505 [Acanthoscelides obtectus]